MCGIAGFVRGKGDTFSAQDVSRSLLLSLEPEGKDATGFAALRNGNIETHKDAAPAFEFVTDMNLTDNPTKAILHTRRALSGSASNPENNQPLNSGSITGAMVGQVRNADEVFDALPVSRQTENNCEALFASLAHGKGSTAKRFVTIGPAAGAFFRGTDLVVFRGHVSTLFIARTTKGSWFFSSTEESLHRMAKSCGIQLTEIHGLPRGTFAVLDTKRKSLNTQEFHPIDWWN